MTPSPVASVVIPTHNAETTLPAQLAALERQTTSVPWDLVLVLNRCTDGTEDLVQAWAASTRVTTHVIVADELASASYARNTGAQQSAGELLLFCDADDIVDAGWIDGMVAVLRSGRDVVGGALRPLEEQTDEQMPAGARVPQQATLPLDRTIRFAVTASMGCTRQCFEAAGGFDDTFRHGADDVVFALRAQQGGGRIGFAPAATCQYRLRSDARTLRKQRVAYVRGRHQLEMMYRPALRRSRIGDLALALGSAARVAIPGETSRDERIVEMHGAVALARASMTAPLDVPIGGRRSERRVGPIVGRISRAPGLATRRPLAAYLRRRLLGQPTLDATMPLDDPIVGGLALAAPAQRAIALSRGDGSPTALRLVEALVESGDHVIDGIGTDGVIAVAAARTCGPDGAITAFEPLPPLSDLLRRNLARHAPGCAARVIDGFPAGRRGRRTAFIALGTGAEVRAVTTAPERPLGPLSAREVPLPRERPIDVAILCTSRCDVSVIADLMTQPKAPMVVLRSVIDPRTLASRLGCDRPESSYAIWRLDGATELVIARRDGARWLHLAESLGARPIG